ncbi:hypothetical protein [Nonomuraea fuscirosea]|uniref:hypothetical protein n=1 Tax=Nonomuraea fuscirosea TaxID=1291556 RepID=UPI0033CC628D
MSTNPMEATTSALDAIPGTEIMARACQAASGSTITRVLDAIAWAYTAHERGGWSNDAYLSHRNGVRDYAGFLYASYDGYPDDAHFDDLRPEHHEPFIASVLASYKGSLHAPYGEQAPPSGEAPVLAFRPLELTPEQWAVLLADRARIEDVTVDDFDGIENLLTLAWERLGHLPEDNPLRCPELLDMAVWDSSDDTSWTLFLSVDVPGTDEAPGYRLTTDHLSTWSFQYANDTPGEPVVRAVLDQLIEYRNSIIGQLAATLAVERGRSADPQYLIQELIDRHYQGDATQALRAVAAASSIAINYLDRAWFASYLEEFHRVSLTDEGWAKIAKGLDGYDEHVCGYEHPNVQHEFAKRLAREAGLLEREPGGDNHVGDDKAWT